MDVAVYNLSRRGGRMSTIQNLETTGFVNVDTNITDTLTHTRT
jgi:hypothetical protein